MVDSTVETLVQSREEAVRAKMLSLDEPKIEILKPDDVEGFSFDNLPDRDELQQSLKQKYPDQPDLEFIVINFYDLLDTSLIKYPPTPEGVTVDNHIEEVDKQILDNFEGEEYDTAHNIILSNRLRTNPLALVQTSLEFAVIILDGDNVSVELNSILDSISGLVDDDYKEERSYDEKMEIARKFSKVVEMAIKALSESTKK